jgi:glycosyltransferase involved in cell wall biosynthesis
MKLAQLLPSINTGGVERGVLDLSKEIQKNKDLDGIVISSGGKMLEDFKKYGITHIKLPVNSKNPIVIFLNIFRLIKIIKKYQINIIHARSRAPAWSGYYACKWTNCRFITTFHGTYSTNLFFKSYSPLKKKYNSIMTKSDKIIAVSNFVKDNILQNYYCDENKIKVIHRGVDLEYFSANNISDERIKNIKKTLNLPKNKKIILLPGRFTSWKGHFLLLEALKSLDKSKYHCLMVGKSDKKYISKLRKKISKYKLENNISIFDSISDMPSLYLVCDIILSTSIRPEAFGRIAIEAGAMEKIIIASNIGGSKETVIDNKTGFLFNPNNPVELTEKIEKCLLLDIKMTKEIEKNAKKRIEESFSSKKMIKNTMEIYGIA